MTLVEHCWTRQIHVADQSFAPKTFFHQDGRGKFPHKTAGKNPRLENLSRQTSCHSTLDTALSHSMKVWVVWNAFKLLNRPSIWRIIIIYWWHLSAKQCLLAWRLLRFAFDVHPRPAPLSRLRRGLHRSHIQRQSLWWVFLRGSAWMWFGAFLAQCSHHNETSRQVHLRHESFAPGLAKHSFYLAVWFVTRPRTNANILAKLLGVNSDFH